LGTWPDWVPAAVDNSIWHRSLEPVDEPAVHGHSPAGYLSGVGRSTFYKTDALTDRNEARLHKHIQDWTQYMNSQGTRPDGSRFTEADYFTDLKDRTDLTRWAQYDELAYSAPERQFGMERTGLVHSVIQELGKSCES